MTRFVMSHVGFWLRVSSFLLLLIGQTDLFAQGVSLNSTGAPPDPSALLDVQSTTQGLLMPRLSSSQRTSISSPAEGLMVYDLDSHSPWTYAASQWQQLVPIPSGVMLWRDDRQDVLMQQAGFTYWAEQLIPNGVSSRAWQTPSPTTNNAPSARTAEIATWVGNRMLIWGGGNIGGSLSDGATYDPANDTWTGIATLTNPVNIGASWTSSGSDLFLFGGGSFFSGTNQGDRYNVATDTWTSMSTVNAPSPRQLAAMCWTGSQVFAWGGLLQSFSGNTYYQDGGLYDPATDSWTSISTTAAPTARQRAQAIYTGSKVVVWGGENLGNPLLDGAIYDPQTDQWSPISGTNAPTGLVSYEVLAASGKMIVFGIDNNTAMAGYLYDLTTDTWSSINMTGGPNIRVEYSLVWTGNELILWGGRNGGTLYDDGYIYDLAGDSWTSLSLPNAPLARQRHSAIWTGQEMMVFGGQAAGGAFLQAPARLRTPGSSIFYLYRKN